MTFCMFRMYTKKNLIFKELFCCSRICYGQDGQGYVAFQGCMSSHCPSCIAYRGYIIDMDMCLYTTNIADSASLCTLAEGFYTLYNFQKCCFSKDACQVIELVVLLIEDILLTRTCAFTQQTLQILQVYALYHRVSMHFTIFKNVAFPRMHVKSLNSLYCLSRIYY